MITLLTLFAFPYHAVRSLYKLPVLCSGVDTFKIKVPLLKIVSMFSLSRLLESITISQCDYKHETHNYHNTIHETGVIKFYTQLLTGVGYVYLIHE
jgi:hypothetical protein